MLNLSKLRSEKAVTQLEVAEAIGVSRVCYNRYELSERECNYETLKKLADYFGVSIDYLLGRTSYRPADTQKKPDVMPGLTKLEKDILSELKNADVEAQLEILSQLKAYNAKVPIKII